MDLDQIRNQWNNIDLPSEAAAASVREIERKVSTTKVTTLRDKLYRLTLNLVVISFLGIATLVPFAVESPEMVLAAGAFFVVMGLVNFYRALNIKHIDLSVMTVKDALESVYNVERQRMIARIVGITCAIPLVIFMIMTFAQSFGPWALYGSLVGVLLGGCIGLAINHRTTQLLREMKSQLNP